MLSSGVADFSKVDNNQRGCRQLASQCQGEGQTLANWLMTNVKNLPETSGHGRSKENKTRGEFSYQYRSDTGPIHKCKGKSHGYKPQDEWSLPKQHPRAQGWQAASSSSSRKGGWQHDEWQQGAWHHRHWS